MTHQRKAVLATLVLVRKSLRNLDEIVPTLRALGRAMSTTGLSRSTTRWLAKR